MREGEEKERDGEIGGDDVDPDVEGERGEEGEEIWILKVKARWSESEVNPTLKENRLRFWL